MKYLLDIVLISTLCIATSFAAIYFSKKIVKDYTPIVDIVRLIELKAKDNPEDLEKYSKLINAKLTEYAKFYGNDIFVKQALATEINTIDITEKIIEELRSDGLLK